MKKSETAGIAGEHSSPSNPESVADVLEREQDNLIHKWLALVEEQIDLMSVPLSCEARTGHLPLLLDDIIIRVRLAAGCKPSISVAAIRHGELRLKQGYSVAMVIEESPLLEVCLFTTLHKNSKSLNYAKLQLEIVTITDEVDRQLKQQVLLYVSFDGVNNKLMN